MNFFSLAIKNINKYGEYVYLHMCSLNKKDRQ